jgi:hypothetical protein
LSSLTPQDKATLINSISPQQTYGTLSLGGTYLTNSNKAVSVSSLSDASGTSETDFMQSQR